MLVGAGAQRFAQECGFPQQEVLSPEARAAYEVWRTENLKTPLLDNFTPTSGYGSHGAATLTTLNSSSEPNTTLPSSRSDSNNSHGTVICLVRGATGSFAGGVSTSGWDYKYPGRLGDSPIIGAGLYVDSRYGAAACTHCGENAIRTALARSVVLYMKRGASVADAVREGLDDLRGLRGGFQGQVVIYATDRSGELFVARRLPTPPPSPYLVWHDELPSFERRHAHEA
jgi:L-asparaginase